MTSAPPKIFISYSHEDEAWKDRLVKQLKVLELEKVLTVWDDRRIAAGADWRPEIEQAMESARVALFLVSADLLTSKFIRESEVPPLLARRGAGLRVIPVVLHACPWRRVTWLESIQGRPKDGEPLALMSDALADAALSALAEEIADLLSLEPLTTGAGIRTPAPRISIAKLPATGEHFVARDDELSHLDAAWAEPETNVISFVAMGGAGKSALVNAWVDRIKADGWRGAERVFGWSFYSQGTESTAASSEAFAEEILDWLGYDGQPITSPWRKGETIARLVRERRTLLLLDGLEPLQHPPGGQTGKLKDPAVQALVKELVAKNPGLCVITTRLAVADVAGRAGAETVDLEQLPPAAGAELLRRLGVRGPGAELEEASAEFGGHGLALSLLGTYLRDVCEGDVRRRSEVAVLSVKLGQGEHARRAMAAYDAWFGEGRERQLLQLMGLFDRPAEPEALAALRVESPIPGLTDTLFHYREVKKLLGLVTRRVPVMAISDAEWNEALARLRQARLIARDDGTGGLDAHPLVREYFGERLEEEQPEAWRAGHERLYEHYRQATDELPETLEAMLPLYTAVVHGCRAGRVQGAVEEVYLRRIVRGVEHFSWHQLGAFGSELTALAAFFVHLWDRPDPRLTAAAQAWILSEVGFVLRALGRLPEAVEPMRAALEAGIAQENWKEAAIRAGNLSELTLTLGEVASAIAAGEESVRLADRSEDDFQRMSKRATLADALHQAGRWEESAAAFREAEEMEAERQPESPRLYSIQGYRYCDLLLSIAERSGSGSPPLKKGPPGIGEPEGDLLGSKAQPESRRRGAEPPPSVPPSSKGGSRRPARRFGSGRSSSSNGACRATRCSPSPSTTSASAAPISAWR